jgi:2-oxoglutarate dehydrogenase E1 component
MSQPITSVFNDGYVLQMYEAYRSDPASVDESWRQFFRFAERLEGTASGEGAADPHFARKVAGAAMLVAAIRDYGHHAVQIDPLGSPPVGAAELAPEFHGITADDLHSVPAAAIPGLYLEMPEGSTAADVVERLRELYCGTIACESEHLGDETEREWFRKVIESGEMTRPLTADEKRRLLERLTEVDGLERFLGIAFVNAKRFSIEGVDALVPMLQEAIVRSGEAGGNRVAIAMAHRGRLNVLTHVLNKPYRSLFREFAGKHADSNTVSGTGDVKYHLGYNTRHELPEGREVDVHLVPNPSHLEFVNPVLMGLARAHQRNAENPAERDEATVLPICVHGDAAFPGEGVVTETLNLAQLRGYRVGGTLHIIANNQVGFTTDPPDARSTHYASDPAKGFEIPVVHVNADDIQACIQAVRLGIEYRKRFGKDFLIDLVGYRRHGHNEADQPSFTQPRLYDVIKKHHTPRMAWGNRLVREGVVTEAEIESLDRAFADRMASIHQEAMAEGPEELEPESAPGGVSESLETGVRAENLAGLNEQLLAWPSGFTIHPTLKRTLPRRREALTEQGIDWGHAEALAFASLLSEGINVRLTGQDAQRGTFSHRQAVIHDIDTGESYTPLANLPQAKGAFEIWNSPLSETAVMAFEYGFSTAARRDLVLWEAQFGDFANVAQPVIDQFLVADRAKWHQDSSLVLLLPHGYEGQGPEHSSARLERFLQLAAEGNMVVAYPSTPAQYFHVLRRHALREERRPLVLMQPKSLLRLPEAASSLEDISSGSFRCLIEDPNSPPVEDVRRLVFCTGKIFYDLAAVAEKPSHIALVRVEELFPWPHEDIAQLVDRYPNVDEAVWVQEEPRNMGAWTFISPRLKAGVGNLMPVRYVGRVERASPAEGHKHTHDVEQARIVEEALAPMPVSSRKRAAASR